MTEAESSRPEIGRLLFRDSDRPDVGSHFALCANDQFHIGRQMVQEALGIEDRCISKHHLSIHCVKYEDDDQRVAPMVWARVLSNNSIIFRRNGLDGEDGGIFVSKEHGAFLINQGDSIQLTNSIWLDFESSNNGHKSDPPRLDLSQRAEVSTFAHRYRLATRVLGAGGYAAVYIANDEKTGKQVACKIVKQPNSLDEEHSLRRVCKATNESVAREFNILKAVSHPNIMTLEAVISTPYNVYIFQDLITGGDLMSYSQRTGNLTEAQTAIIIRQLLEAVKYLHANGIVHRDIKPENILMTSWRDGGRIVLTDFGQARLITAPQTADKRGSVFRMQTLVGTPGYSAPEIGRLRSGAAQEGLQLRGHYSKAIDIWSVGCVACALLGHDVLFPDDAHNAICDLSKEDYDKRMAEFNSGEDWTHIGCRAKEFIRGCLEFDDEHRLTATEALDCEWFTHQHYRAEMDAAYKRAVADWQPKKYNIEDLIQEIDTTMHVERAVAQHEAGGEQEEERSRYFLASTTSTPTRAQHRFSEHSRQASQFSRCRSIDQLHASSLAPASSSPGETHREEPAEESMSVPYPPDFAPDEFDDDSFQEWTAADFDDVGLHPAKKVAVQFQEGSCSFPAPPTFRSRTTVFG
ncbi:hypothetical protein BST61_g5924 [Cercospora zeina]